MEAGDSHHGGEVVEMAVVCIGECGVCAEVSYKAVVPEGCDCGLGVIALIEDYKID